MEQEGINFYDSPIHLQMTNPMDRLMMTFEQNMQKARNDVNKELEDTVVMATWKCGVYIEKEKLIQALTLDKERYQEAYRMGFNDGYSKREEELCESGEDEDEVPL